MRSIANALGWLLSLLLYLTLSCFISSLTVVNTKVVPDNFIGHIPGSILWCWNIIFLFFKQFKYRKVGELDDTSLHPRRTAVRTLKPTSHKNFMFHAWLWKEVLHEGGGGSPTYRKAPRASGLLEHVPSFTDQYNLGAFTALNDNEIAATPRRGLTFNWKDRDTERSALEATLEVLGYNLGWCTGYRGQGCFFLCVWFFFNPSRRIPT
jgi:hypothetical protein